MYSLVVLMALGTAGQAPDWGCGWGGGYGGYCGGYGGGYCGGWGGGYCGGYGGYSCGWGGYGGCGYGGGWGGCYSPCYSYSACYAPVYSYCAPVCYPSHIMPAQPYKGGKEEKGGKKGEEVSLNQATIVVNLPADAKLTFDGAATQQSSAHRVFVTPELQPGVEYSYVVKAEMKRDGKPVTAEKKVSFKAGQTTEVTLGEPAAGVASR